MINWSMDVAAPLTLMNYTIVEASSVDEMTARVNLMINFFRAVGGIFILGIIAWIITLRNTLKQKKLLEEMNKKLDKLAHKRK